MKQIMKQGWAVMTALLLTAGIVFTACTQNKNNNETTETETEAEWEPVQTEVSVDDLKALAEVLPNYYVYSGFHDGLILVSDNETELYGFIDKTGKEVIPCQFDDAKSFSEGIAIAYKDGQKLLIDLEGNTIASIGDTYGHECKNGLLAFLEKQENTDGEYLLGYMDKTGKVVIPANKYKVILTERDNFYDFSEGLCRVMDFDNYRNFFIDKTGKEVFECDGYADDFHDGLAAIGSYNEETEEFLFGFIDKTGKQVIPSRFTAVGEFKDGLCCVFEKEKAGFIDKEGNWVITGDYKAIALYEYLEDSEPLCSTFCDGLAWMCNKEGKFGYIDREGKVVIPFRYEPGIEEFGEDEVCYSEQPVFDFHQGLARVWDKATGKYGFIDKEGNEVFPCEFELADDVSEGAALVMKDDKFGFVTPDGHSTFDF